MKKGENTNLSGNDNTKEERMTSRNPEIKADTSGFSSIATDSGNDTETEDVSTSIHIDTMDEYDLDLDWDVFHEVLKQQVNDELSVSEEEDRKLKKNRILKRSFAIAGITLGVLCLFVVFLVGTKPGRRMIYRIAGDYIHDRVDQTDNTMEEEGDSFAVSGGINDSYSKNAFDYTNKTDTEENTSESVIIPRQEDYVSTFLVFGIEEIGGAKNTDAILLASINTRDKTIKLTSLLRDTLVNVPGYTPRKLNAVYAKGGASLLTTTIEQNYRVKIDGYASIDFEDFEAVIDFLGGVSIELGEKEANYLNRKNYISNPAYRNVVPGWNNLNGNQALGYCRVRKVPTLGGSNDDYGRTLRQRRVMTAVFNKYKNKNVFDLLSITTKCLGYVKTNVTQAQIEGVLEDIVENKITTMETMRIPVNGMFDELDEYNGVSSPLVLEWENNINELYQFIFLDEKNEQEKNIVTNKN